MNHVKIYEPLGTPNQPRNLLIGVVVVDTGQIRQDVSKFCIGVGALARAIDGACQWAPTEDKNRNFSASPMSTNGYIWCSNSKPLLPNYLRYRCLEWAALLEAIIGPSSNLAVTKWTETPCNSAFLSIAR